MKLQDLINELQYKLDVYKTQGVTEPTIEVYGYKEFYTVWNFSGKVTIILKGKE